VLHIVALRYAEPYYADTEACLLRTSAPITWVERSGGVGSLSAAFNSGFRRLPPEADLVWFTTDVTFDADLPDKLAAALGADPGLWAIHPAHMSDHLSHRPDDSGEVRDVPYIEFTAPMVRVSAFRAAGGLDENHWYWYQDLLFSKEVREQGGRMAVHHGAVLGHVYRRNCVTHPVTQRRYQMRNQRDSIERALLERRFGRDWRKHLWV